MSRKTLRKNFTLVELLTVIAIIGVLIGIVMGLMSMASGKMAEARTRSLISQISVALENYKAKYGYYIQAPTVAAFYLDVVTSGATAGATDNITSNFCQFIDYQAMVNKDTTRYTPSSAIDSSNRAWVVDGYGNPLIYRCPGFYNRNSFDLGSVGSDGKYGSGGSAFSAGTEGATGTAGSYKGSNNGFGTGDDMVNFTR